MFLGVDGGGTKTAFCLLDANGKYVVTTVKSTCCYLSVGMDETQRVLDEGIHSVCRKAGITFEEIDHAFFGIPAYGEGSQVIEVLNAIPRRILGHHRYLCDNDMVCGWAGSLGAIDGINVIAGTGSMTYGENQGRGFRCGGWGEVFGDEGSAYWIACRGLNTFTRMSDGRLEKGPLYDLFSSHFNITSDLDLIDIVQNQWNSDRGKIAELAKVVIKAAYANDQQALKTLDDSASELAHLVDITHKKLAFDSSIKVPVSYSGGIFQEGLVTRSFAEKLSKSEANYDLRRPLYSPEIGAAIYAAKQAKTPLKIIPKNDSPD